MGDTAKEVIDALTKLTQIADTVSPLSGYIPVPGAKPALAAGDAALHVLTNAATAVYNWHGGGKSWVDSVLEVLRHLSADDPFISPALTPRPSAIAGPNVGSQVPVGGIA
jgi:hypothetical protein